MSERLGPEWRDLVSAASRTSRQSRADEAQARGSHSWIPALRFAPAGKAVLRHDPFGKPVPTFPDHASSEHDLVGKPVPTFPDHACRSWIPALRFAPAGKGGAPVPTLPDHALVGTRRLVFRGNLRRAGDQRIATMQEADKATAEKPVERREDDV